jgi:hypothetical protein
VADPRPSVTADHVLAALASAHSGTSTAGLVVRLGCTPGTEGHRWSEGLVRRRVADLAIEGLACQVDTIDRRPIWAATSEGLAHLRGARRG